VGAGLGAAPKKPKLGTGFFSTAGSGTGAGLGAGCGENKENVPLPLGAGLFTAAGG